MANGGANYIDGHLKIKAQALFSSIKKFRDKEQEEIKAMEKSGKAVQNEYLEDYAKTYNLYKCYNELYNSKPSDETDLHEIAWLFNKGELRTAEEMEQHKKDLEAERYYNSGFYNDVGFAYKEVSIISNAYFLLPFILAPIIPFLIGMIDVNSSTKDFIGFCLIFNFTYIFSLLIHLYISWALALKNGWEFDKKIKEYYDKAHLKKPANKYLIADTAMFGASLLYFGIKADLKPDK